MSLFQLSARLLEEGVHGGIFCASVKKALSASKKNEKLRTCAFCGGD